MVVLGAHQLPHALLRELSAQDVCPTGEYDMGQRTYSLDFRIVEGDVTKPENAFKTDDFSPHGE